MFRRNILPPSKGWKSTPCRRDGQWCREGQGQELRADQLQRNKNSSCTSQCFTLNPATCPPISVTDRFVPHGLLFYPENRGSAFLRNADKLLPDYKTSTLKETVIFILVRVTILLASYILLVAYLAHFWPWRWRQYVPPKRLWIRLHSRRIYAS
jgi:hypothetical protein